MIAKRFWPHCALQMSALILLNLISIIVIKSSNAGAPRIVGGIEANIGKKQFAKVFLIHYLVVKIFL
jgi:hypothetical protein